MRVAGGKVLAALITISAVLLEGCATVSTAPADPTLLNNPVFAPLVAGPKVTIEWVSVNGRRAPGDALQRALDRFKKVILGELQVHEGEPRQLDLGEDGKVSREQYEEIIEGSARRGPAEMLLVFAPGFDFEDAQAIYDYVRVDGDGDNSRPHLIRVSDDGLAEIGALHWIVSAEKVWESTLIHELLHSLAIPSNKSHAWDVRHCTHVGCVLYPGVMDLRSTSYTISHMGLTYTLCQTCRREIKEAQAAAANQRWDNLEDYGWVWLDQLVAMNADNPAVYRIRLRELAKRGDYPRMLEDVARLVTLEPREVEHYRLRGSIHRAMGDYGRAIDDFEYALRLDGNNVRALGGLAWTLATAPEMMFRDGLYAVGYAMRACELSEWRDANQIDTLAAACAASGDFEAAIGYQIRAVDLLAEGDVEDAEDFHKRLELYKAGKPYFEADVPGTDNNG